MDIYQPSGTADFSKFYNINDLMVTYTNIMTGKSEMHSVETKEILDDYGNKKLVYILPTSLDV